MSAGSEHGDEPELVSTEPYDPIIDSTEDDLFEPTPQEPGASVTKEVKSDHRGAFGEFGGAETGFLDRAFRERIILVGVALGGATKDETNVSLDEMALLIDTAGADVADRIIQTRQAPDASTFIGKGKAQEVLDSALAHDADTVVFDNELSPAQQFNLERIFKRSALDRTAVILDIFAQHATSAEGKTQVELAQLRYRLPRLRGKKNFSQQAGGIGTRGPGETQLEVDRRRLVRKIHKLEKELRSISDRRSNQRKASHRSPFSRVSIVGYTNAGKSSLLRKMTGAEVLIEDRLFATLDPTTRKYQLPGGEQILMTDTVGFVKKLPHQLVEAFKSTLEVSIHADLLIHVVDGAGPEPEAHITAVREVLREIGATDIPQLLVFNKSDLSPEVKKLVDLNPGSVGVSAITGDGLDELVEAVGKHLRAGSVLCELFVPYDRGDVAASIHREGQVLTETSEDAGMRFSARLEPDSLSRLEDFVVEVAHG